MCVVGVLRVQAARRSDTKVRGGISSPPSPVMVMIRERSGVRGCFFASCSSAVQLTLLKVKRLVFDGTCVINMTRI